MAKEYICPDCYFEFNNKVIEEKVHTNNPRKRAGIFLYHKESDKVLVVQSYNKFFGLPKGGLEEGESNEDTAIRELHEETGVSLGVAPVNLKSMRKFYFDTCVFYIINTEELYPLSNSDIHDSTGCGWIHIECLKKLEKFGKITAHLGVSIRKILKREISKKI